MALRVVAIVVLVSGVVGLQLLRERLNGGLSRLDTPAMLYVRSPEAVKRLALSYTSLMADVYWVRALQHYGRSRLGLLGGQRYELLFPLLDVATTLDPRFNVPYRFGAIFLTEPPPGGPGRPDLAITLLEKGLQAQPRRWELAQDIGFVHYRAGDYLAAAEWFGRAAEIPDSPNWLPLLEAVTRTQGGSRDASRQIWQHIAAQASPEEEWIRVQASFRLQQLEALDQIDALTALVREHQAAGRPLSDWNELVARGRLRGVPLDPAGFPYRLDSRPGSVTLDPQSPLHPLPAPEAATP